VRTLEREVERETGLPLAWYDVLLELSTAGKGGLRMGELGERAVLSRTRVSRLVDELTGAGLVRRSRDPNDGRSWHAEITTAGRAAFRRAAPRYLQAVRDHFGRHLSGPQLDTIRAAMETLVERHASGDDG